MEQNEPTRINKYLSEVGFCSRRAADKLIEQGDAALGEIMAQWPGAESTLLRQWIRQHPKEITQGRQKAHAKKLFRYLSDLDRAEPSTD